MARTRTWQAVLVLPLVAAGTMLATTEAAHADDRVCRGTIGARSIDDNVVVPRGAVCVLVRTRVDGNVEVRRGGVLRAKGVRVEGNVQGEGARRVVVRGKDGVRSRIGGDIQLDDGRRGGRILRAVVEGDIQLFSNRGRFRVRGNVVDGNLQCKGNSPRPVGGNNRVHGNKEDQCRRL